MKRTLTVLALVTIAFSLLNSCTKKSETFSSASLNDYFPLAVGKSYIYRLDSTVLGRFGSALIVNSYQAKDSVESTFNDNQGRLSYRIFRYIRDTSATQPWRFAATYYATPTRTNLEYVDNNLRFLKLQLPITEGVSWKAHSYIDNQTFSYLSNWEYQYQNQDQPYNIFNKTFDSTVTVFQNDETTPPGPFNPNLYQQHNHGYEVFAKGVGLIYKDFMHWTWQTSPAPAKYEDGSYGVRLRLISHN